MALPGVTSKLQPDNRIDVNIHFQHGDAVDTYCVPQPRVVLEAAFSQNLLAAEGKAWEYLCAGDGHTHAVIIVDMTYPVSQEKTFVAKIAVWSRADAGRDGKYGASCVSRLTQFVQMKTTRSRKAKNTSMSRSPCWRKRTGRSQRGYPTR
jgi:hypothetical protein